MNSGAQIALISCMVFFFFCLFFIFAIANLALLVSVTEHEQVIHHHNEKYPLFSLRSVLTVYEICSRPGLSHWNSWFKNFMGTINFSCFYHGGL